jgi:DNA-binding IscR family transcriptional regulator
VHGGVTLARAADQISICEVCRALDDPILEKRCMLGVSECSEARACPAHAFNSLHRERTMDFLTKTTIADVAAFEMQRRWDRMIMPHTEADIDPPPATGIEGLG